MTPVEPSRAAMLPRLVDVADVVPPATSRARTVPLLVDRATTVPAAGYACGPPMTDAEPLVVVTAATVPVAGSARGTRVALPAAVVTAAEVPATPRREVTAPDVAETATLEPVAG